MEFEDAEKLGREADGWWLSYPQMFNTYILINRLNGCLVGANSTCLPLQAHLYPLVSHSSRPHNILLNVDRCLLVHTHGCKYTHTYKRTQAQVTAVGGQHYQPPTTFIHHDSTQPNDSNILHSLWRYCTGQTKLVNGSAKPI